MGAGSDAQHGVGGDGLAASGGDVASDFADIFAVVRGFYAVHEWACVVLHDEPGRYYLATHAVRPKDGYRLWFGGVEIKKSYVSAHVMALYTDPDLMGGVSETLRKRMQGKACFNFKVLDSALLEQLGALIDSCAARYAATGKLKG